MIHSPTGSSPSLSVQFCNQRFLGQAPLTLLRPNNSRDGQLVDAGVSSGSDHDDGSADVDCGVDGSTSISIVRIEGSMMSSKLLATVVMGVSIANRDLDQDRVQEQASARSRSGPVDAAAATLEATGPRPPGRLHLQVPLPLLPHTLGLANPSQMSSLRSQVRFSRLPPLGQRHKGLSREQSLAQVAAGNQQEKMVHFPAWTVETGQWGGRALGVPEALAEGTDPILSLTP
jgi:hypothetical protein